MKTTTRHLATALVIVWLGTGCASAPPRPPLADLGDIPGPPGLTYQPDRSTVIESASATAARLVYRGRVRPDNVRAAMRAALQAHGWRHVSTGTGATGGTVQAYEKGGDALQLDISKGLWFTYVALDVSRALTSAPPPGAAAAPYRAAPPASGDVGAAVPAPALGAEAPSAPPSEQPDARVRSRGAWESFREGGAAVGRTVRQFFTTLFSN